MAPTHNEYQTIVGSWWIVGFFVFFNSFSSYKKYKIVQSLMILSSESNALDVINTDDTIKEFAPQKERKKLFI
jgi:hypothetical protein